MRVVNYRWPPRRAHSSMFQMATCLRHRAACVMSAGWIKKQGQGQRQQGGVSHPLTLRINIELSLRRKRMDKGWMTRGKFQKDINVRRWDLRHHLDQESATVSFLLSEPLAVVWLLCMPKESQAVDICLSVRHLSNHFWQQCVKTHCQPHMHIRHSKWQKRRGEERGAGVGEETEKFNKKFT